MNFWYWQHDSFELDLLTDAECKSEFRFYGNYIYKLTKVLNISDEIISCNWSKCDDIEVFNMILKRIPYPCRYFDIIQQCSCSVPEQILTLLNMLTFANIVLLDLRNLWKILFISSKKFFLFLRYSNCSNFFFPFHTFQILKDK